MQIRSLVSDDRDALLRIWNDGAEFDPLTRALLEEKIWEDADFNDGLSFVAETQGAVLGFAVGVVRESGAGFVKLLAVDRAAQRQGIGRALLERLEAAMAAAGSTTIRLLESAPNYLTPGIDTRYRGAIAFAERCGYRPLGIAKNLVVDLDKGLSLLRHAAAAEGIEVRRAGAGDAQALQAFLSVHWPAWVAEAMSALGNSPSTLHIAIRNGAVIGFAAADANNRNTGWFGPMGVSPDERQSGIGRVLLQRCLADLQQQGHAQATIPWVDPVEFYEKCAGAEPSRTFARYEKELTA